MLNVKSKIITVLLLVGLVGLVLGCEAESDDPPFMVSTGANHGVLLTNNEVYTWGTTIYGVLGNGESNIDVAYADPQNITENFDLEDDEVITFVTSGKEHSFAISSNGRVFGWGRNNFNQIYQDGDELILTPIDITDQFDLAEDDEIISISAKFQSVALSLNGDVFVFGEYYPRVEDGYTLTNLTDLLDLGSNETIIEIDFNRVLTSLGRVFTWGLNDAGQLCDNSTVNKDDPVDITDNYDLNDDEIITGFLGEGCTVNTNQSRTLTFLTVVSGNTVDHRFLDLTEAWLDNENFLIDQASGTSFGYYLDDSFTLYVYGRNNYGQLLVDDEFVMTPCYLEGDDNNCFDKEDFEPLNDYFDLEENETILSVQAGDWHGVVVTSLDNVYLFGRNNYGQLGDATFNNSSVPVKLNIMRIQNGN